MLDSRFIASSPAAIGLDALPGLRAAQIAALDSDQIRALGTEQIAGLSRTQIASQIDSLVSQALQAANANSDGHFIYGGSKDQASPYTAVTDATGKVTTGTYVDITNWNAWDPTQLSFELRPESFIDGNGNRALAGLAVGWAVAFFSRSLQGKLTDQQKIASVFAEGNIHYPLCIIKNAKVSDLVTQPQSVFLGISIFNPH